MMKLASSEARNSAALATSQAVPILRRSGTRASRSAATWAAALAAHPGARVDRHRRVHQTGQDHIGTNAILRILDRHLLGESDHRRLRRLVCDKGVVLQCGKRGDHDDGARALLSHDRDDVLAGHDGAAQVDGTDPVESFLRKIEQRGIAAGDADADIVMKNVDAAPAFLRCRYGGGECCFFGDVGFEGDAFPAPLLDHRSCLLRREEVTIDSHDLRTLLRESQRRGTAIAHPFARALAGANNDGSFSF